MRSLVLSLIIITFFKVEIFAASNDKNLSSLCPCLCFEELFYELKSRVCEGKSLEELSQEDLLEFYEQAGLASCESDVSSLKEQLESSETLLTKEFQSFESYDQSSYLILHGSLEDIYHTWGLVSEKAYQLSRESEARFLEKRSLDKKQKIHNNLLLTELVQINLTPAMLMSDFQAQFPLMSPRVLHSLKRFGFDIKVFPGGFSYHQSMQSFEESQKEK